MSPWTEGGGLYRLAQNLYKIRPVFGGMDSVLHITSEIQRLELKLAELRAERQQKMDYIDKQIIAHEKALVLKTNLDSEMQSKLTVFCTKINNFLGRENDMGISYVIGSIGQFKEIWESVDENTTDHLYSIAEFLRDHVTGSTAIILSKATGKGLFSIKLNLNGEKILHIYSTNAGSVIYVALTRMES
jgi:hypothetical protein